MTAQNAAVQAAIAAAAAQTDMTKATKGGGGSYTPPAEGLARLRFVGYIECGKVFDEKYNKTKEKVKLIFELSGPKHAPKKLDDGTELPHRITITESLSLNEKANFYKIFKAMNYAGEATHIAQLLGQEFLGTVVHRKYKDRVFANLRDDSGYTIRAPFVEDPETGETRKVPAGPQISETRCFLWDYASKEMWDSIFIEGEYEEEKNEAGEVIRAARSKNVFQEEIRAAINFAGSPIAEILEGEDLAIDEPELAQPAEDESTGTQSEEEDPLAGIS